MSTLIFSAKIILTKSSRETRNYLIIFCQTATRFLFSCEVSTAQTRTKWRLGKWSLCDWRLDYADRYSWMTISISGVTRIQFYSYRIKLPACRKSVQCFAVRCYITGNTRSSVITEKWITMHAGAYAAVVLEISLGLLERASFPYNVHSFYSCQSQ